MRYTDEISISLFEIELSLAGRNVIKSNLQTKITINNDLFTTISKSFKRLIEICSGLSYLNYYYHCYFPLL